GADETRVVDVVLLPSANSFLREVVVTSRKREVLKEELTSAVTIVNPVTMRELQSVNNNVSEILAVSVPGLGVSSGTSSNWGQSLRGRSVLILVDGVPQSTPLRNGSVDMRTIDANAVERIEVIKGATSLYGNGAAGGMINYITKNNSSSQQKLAGRTEVASTGSVFDPKGTFGGRIYQSLYGKSGRVNYLVSGSYEQTGKVRDAEGDIVGPTYGLSNNRVYNALGKFGFEISPKQRLQVNYNFFKSLQQNNLQEIMGSRVDGRKTLAVEGNTPGSDPGTRWNHNALVKYTNDQLIGATGLNVSAYLNDFSTVFFYSPQFEGGGQSTIRSSKKGLRLDFNTPVKLSDVTFGDITYGVDFLNDITSQPLLDGRTWVPEMNMVSSAPFLQLQGTVLRDLVFNGGLRYELINIGVEDYTTLKPYNAQTGGFGTSIDVRGGDLSYSNLVFNSGLRYNKFDFFKPYVNFSQGFSVGDVGLVLRAARLNDISNIQTEAVIVNNYETGFASEFKSFRFEASAYISKSKLGSSFIEQDGFYVIVRQPEQVHGFELAADAYATRNLMLGATYSYVEGKRDGNSNDRYNDPVDTYLGGERISPPKYTVYAKFTPSPKFTIRTDLIASGERNRFNPGATGIYKTYEGKVDAYEIVNLSSSYQLSTRTQLRLGIENLFNADYFPSRSLWPSINQYYIKGRGTNFSLGLSFDLK
ncbi:MAG TPA: TonB-dependent receptor, partial [Sphingobacteriaceae bacterium]